MRMLLIEIRKGCRKSRRHFVLKATKSCSKSAAGAVLCIRHFWVVLISAWIPFCHGFFAVKSGRVGRSCIDSSP